MTKLTVSLLAVAVAAIAMPALGADLVLPTGVVTEPAPAALNNTLTFEVSPEFYAIGTSSHAGGQLADWYGKIGYGYNFGSGFSGSLAAQDTFKATGSATDLAQQNYEGALAYKLAVTKDLSFTVSGLLGYTAGNTGYVGGVASGGKGPADLGNSDDGYFYYAVSGAFDWKIDSHWTWNVVNVRYRNAFDRTWITPKVATGVTYKIDDADSVYASIGYGWKDNGNGSGLQSDKFNVAVGYKYSF
jgi:hypothetical protein